MPRDALRLLGVLLLSACACGAAPPPMATVKIGGTAYVRATDVAGRLGLRLRWQAYDRLVLADARDTIEAPAPGAVDSKEISINGLKVWLGDPVVGRSGQVYFSRIDYERRLIPLLRPDLAGPPPGRPHVIALDPGHGGSDAGTENHRLGLMEKTFTLDVALRLQKLLTQAGYQVVMTRTADLRSRDKLELIQRAEIANLAHADLFLSIHFNAGATASDSTSHGTEVYTFPPEHQRSTASWGEKEDDSEPNRKFPGRYPANRFDGWSAVFARTMQQELHGRLGTEDRGERLRHLGVLRALNCPGILVESAFLTNDPEARRVAAPAFRQQIAEAMLAGIRAYAAELDSLRPPVPAAPALSPPPAQGVAAQKPLLPPQRPQ